MSNPLVIKLNDEDIEKCNKFAEDFYLLHFAHKRNSETIKKNIFIGKLGEVGYSKMNPSLSSVNFEGSFPDPGYDFIDNGTGKLIEIKTINELWKKRVYININRAKCDIYILVYVNLEKKEACYIGSIFSKNIEYKMFYDANNEAHYILRNYFQ